MNKENKRRLAASVDKLEGAKSIIKEIKDVEEETWDKLSDNAKESERGGAFWE